MLKKIVLVSVVFLFTVLSIAYISAKDESEKSGEKQLETIMNNDIPWSDNVGDITHELDMSPETAKKIAEILLPEVTNNNINDKVVTVKKVQDEDIYVVSYAPQQEQLGGDLNIAINARNCEVLKIWAGE